MNRQDITKRFTEIVNEYLAKGMTFSVSMSGSQGEQMKVDLTDGKYTYRIRLESFTDFTDWSHGLEIFVERFDEVVICSMSTLWNGKGDQLLHEKFYKTSDREEKFYMK